MSKPDKERLKEVAAKWMRGTLTPEEERWLDEWYNANGGRVYWVNDHSEETLFSRLAADFERRKKETAPVRFFTWKTVIAAAISVLALAFTFYFMRSGDIFRGSGRAPEAAIVPGANRAMLTLADGTSIELREDHNGIILGEDIVYEDGTAVVDPEVGASGGPQEKLSISTPKGGQYQVILPDGTKAWLNAASSLTYTATSGDRIAALAGEAFFDVRGTKGTEGRPFRVHTRGQEITVLGTQFNVSAYEDEAETKTTLVNGAVQVNVSGHNRVFQLKPGEQAISTASNMQLIEVDTESVTGWKDGNFHFNNEHIRSVMKKIARWYDAEVTFEGELPADGFDGTVARSADITQVLRKLELTGRVKFKIAERRIIVMP